MDVTPLVRKGAKIIQSYSGGRFKISGTVYDSPVIVTEDNVIPWAVKPALEEMGKGDFSQLFPLAGQTDVILLGTGSRMQFLLPYLRTSLREKGIKIEAMDTGAACRTYNVLMAEGRRVAAALFPLDN